MHTQRATLLYYKIERTYLTNADGKHDRVRDRTPYLVPADSASAAAVAFMTHEQALMLGPVTHLKGDKAMATAEIGSRVYVIFVQRAVEAIRPD